MTTPDKKKGKLSRMFGGKETHDQSSPSDVQPSSTSNIADSAYASSENDHRSKNSHSDYTHLENTGQIQGVSEDRKLAVNKGTGDVVDEDSGEVVSTVTTTTTTTTTTTSRKAGGSKSPTVEVTTTPSAPVIQEMPTARDNTPPASQVFDNPPRPSETSYDTRPPRIPDVPSRSPNRSSDHMYSRSRERLDNPVSPVDTSAHNFSYPNARQEPSGSYDLAGNPVQSGRGGTLDNLKAAAVGIHGVGETLRGTLNNNIDQRWSKHSSNPDKMAYVNSKNQATLDAGRREMAGVRERQGLQPTTSNVQTDQTQRPYYLNHPSENYNANPSPPDNGQGSYLEPDHYYNDPRASYGGVNSYETNTSNSWDQSDPGASSTEKKVRKLFKRRPGA